MIAALPLITEWASAIAVVEGVGGLAVLGGIAGMLVCHQSGCYRLGRFRHGQYKLCHVHHPLVPSDGKITAEHIAAVTKALSK